MECYASPSKEYGMTKQEEIKEGIADILRITRAEGELHKLPTFTPDRLLAYLHSQGVVIKSKNQMVPVTFGGLLKDNKDIFRVEPLVEE